MEKYLVTGAAGFIGSAVARQLIIDGSIVWTIDDLSTGSESNLAEGAKLLVGSCHDPEIISQIGDEKFDAIIHLAGQSSGEVSFDDPINDLKNNVESTLQLLNFALRTGCNRFIYGSSASVYGDARDLLVSESSNLQPLSCYGVGKLASEKYLQVFNEAGIHTTALRFSNVYGPRQNLENMRQGMVSIYLAQLISDAEAIVVKGPLERTRDFVFIEDVVRVIIQTIKNSKAFGQVYNVGSGETHSVGQLLDILMLAYGVKKKIVLEKGTPGDQKCVQVCIEKIRRDLEYRPLVKLEDGIARMIDWVKGNDHVENSLGEPSCCRLCFAESKLQSVRSRNVSGGNPIQKFWKCNRCDVIYLFPPSSEDEEEIFYRNDFEEFMGRRSGKTAEWQDADRHQKLNGEERDRRFSFLSKYLEEVTSCLEIGCSSGFMLSALRGKGIDVVGIEPSEKFSQYLGGAGIPVYSDWTKFCESNKAKFDLIIHYYVLEHIREPARFLQQCMDRLNPKGLMVFEVPCAADPLVELYSVPAFDKFYWSVAHHWYFNRNSLQHLLSQVTGNFKLFPEQRYDISNHLVWMLEGKPGGTGRYMDTFGADLDHLYKKRMKATWQSDTLVAVLQKC